jgi:Cu-processing system permease protein
MKNILTLSILTFHKLLRDRVVFAAFFVALFLFGLTFLLGALSFDEQLRILIHFGATAVHLSLLGLAVFIGANVVQDDIENQTLLLLLARPVTRSQYYFGQWLGIFHILGVNWLVLVVVLYSLSAFSLPFMTFLLAMMGILFESLLLAAFVLLAASVMRPAIAIFAATGIFLIGNWLPDLDFFARKSGNAFFAGFSDVVNAVFPQLYRMNWRSLHLIQNRLVEPQFFQVTIHFIGWTLLMLLAGSLLFRRKDLV